MEVRASDVLILGGRSRGEELGMFSFRGSGWGGGGKSWSGIFSFQGVGLKRRGQKYSHFRELK